MNPKKKRVAIYVRVSTNKQTNLNQFKELKRAAAFHNWEVVAVFKDHAQTGANTNRPGFQSMLHFIRRKRIDSVAIWSLSRIGRSVQDLVNFLNNDLRPHHVDLFSLNDNIDTGTASGRMIYQILAAVAEYEREHTIEKVMAALDRARAQGKKLGTPTLETPGSKRYRPDLVEQILNLKAEGKGIKKIAAITGCAPGTVRRIAKANNFATTETEEATA